jgi:hypothetical protein
MPNIPYPNVPPLPGVPALARSNNAQFAGAALNIVGQLLPLSLFGTKWGIVDKNGAAVISPDSFVDFEYREERKIPNYPIEQGSFNSYNKVAVPFDIRVTVSCSGNTLGVPGRMSKQAFLTAIQALLNSLDLVSVVTPNNTYNNCNLVHVDYRREARQGATLILAQLWFQEVRIAQKPVVPTAQPSGTSSTSFGQLSPTTTPTGEFGSINANSRGATGLNPAIK